MSDIMPTYWEFQLPTQNSAYILSLHRPPGLYVVLDVTQALAALHPERCKVWLRFEGSAAWMVKDSGVEPARSPLNPPNPKP